MTLSSADHNLQDTVVDEVVEIGVGMVSVDAVEDVVDEEVS